MRGTVVFVASLAACVTLLAQGEAQKPADPARLEQNLGVGGAEVREHRLDGRLEGCDERSGGL